jgi:uncharacterized membrane protein YoaK (UPF0700 family)
MFVHKLYEDVEPQVYLKWFLLSFIAGQVNAGGYLACSRFVSHVTGFATLAGIDFSQRNWLDAVGALSIPIFFLIGVMISAFLIEKNLVAKSKGQKFAPVMDAVGAIMLLVAVGGTYDVFGKFGSANPSERDYLLLALLCGACGLQNGAITSASGSTIRTTHLTGIVTDLGLALVKGESSQLTPAQKKIERKSNFLRVLTIFSFFFGSLIGAVLFIRLEYWGFLLPAILAFYCAWDARRI